MVPSSYSQCCKCGGLDLCSLRTATYVLLTISRQVKIIIRPYNPFLDMNMEQCISDRKMSIAYKISNSLEFDVQFTPVTIVTIGQLVSLAWPLSMTSTSLHQLLMPYYSTE